MIGGGSYAKNKTDKNKDAIREFDEETGHKVNENNIKHIYESKKYSVSFYKVNTITEYNKFKKLNVKKKSKFKELTKIYWVSFKEAKRLFSNVKRFNKPCNGSISFCINNYIKYLNKWDIYNMEEFREIKLLLINYKNNRVKFISTIKKHLKKYIIKRSYIDWFDIGLNKLRTFLKREKIFIT